MAMKRPNRIALVMVFACLAAGPISGSNALMAQERPDFSGRWTTDAESAAAAGRGGQGRGGARGDMGSGWGSTITIAQTATSLTVEYAFFTRGDMQPPLRFTYALDGSRSSNTVMMGRGMQTQVSRAAWNGPALTITTTHAFVDPASGKSMPVDVKQALSLESPTSLIVVTTRPGVMGGPETTTRSVYRKIP